MLSGRDIEVLVKKEKLGDLEYYYGPFRFGGSRIWEIWVWDGPSEEYDTRFVLEDFKLRFDIFGTFAELADQLNNLYCPSHGKLVRLIGQELRKWPICKESVYRFTSLRLFSSRRF